MYTLSSLADEGHVYAYKGQLIKRAAELLEAEESSIVMTLDQMLADKDVISEPVSEEKGDAIYLPPFYYAEVGLSLIHISRLWWQPADQDSSARLPLAH